MKKEYNTLKIIISTGRSNELLGKNITLENLETMSEEEIEAYFKIYEINYSSKVSSCISSAIINFYSYAINKIVPIDDIEKLQEDLNNSYILTNELKNITGSLAMFGGKLFSLVELGLTTFKHIKAKTIDDNNLENNLYLENNNLEDKNI